jgi:integrase
MSIKKDKAEAGKGTLEKRGTRWYGRITQEDGSRPRIPLGKDMSEARAREVLAAYVERIQREALVLPKKVSVPADPEAIITVRQLGEAWTSGEMLKKYGQLNGLRMKRSMKTDRYMLRRDVYPILGDKHVVQVTDTDIDSVMAKAPSEWSPRSRQKLYLLLHRLFDLAIAPVRLRKDSPVTSYHRPRIGRPKLFSYLYPKELLALLACKAIFLWRRVLYALAVYTGLRKSSLFAIKWSNVDFDNGTLLSTVSKTEIAQMFEIPPDLVAVLKRWRACCGQIDVNSAVVRKTGKRDRDAQELRKDLRDAGVTRSVLFQRTANIEPLRFHDLRATFVTWAKRVGNTDGWISDRTGHLTQEMIDRYTRAARTLADLRMDPFPDLTEAIPELSTSSSTSSST